MPIEILLLLALPASGKSELRRYLEWLDAETAFHDLQLRPTVQLDDYPYVQMMRRIGEETRAAGDEPVFFASNDGRFLDPRDWGTLTYLINFDYHDLTDPPAPLVNGTAAQWLFDRLDRARTHAEMEPALRGLAPLTRKRLASALELEAQALFDGIRAAAPKSMEEVTVVIEFSRGGPEDSSFPLPPPHGYGHALTQLSEEILDRAKVLYVWVEPEVSRRKNVERAKPGREGQGSILYHGVPDAVMRSDYGTDDLMWLLAASGGSCVVVERGEGSWALPTGVFDNRTDLTSFLRDDPEKWSTFKLRRVHQELVAATAGFRV